MARMHTKGRGKSKSRKPSVAPSENPEWLKKSGLTKEQVREIIIDAAKKKMHQAQIGQMLKEKYGVLYVKQLFGKRLGDILEEEGLAPELPQDLLDLLKKAVNIRKHLAANHKDVHNKVRLQRVESKIWRLTKYYKKVGTLPQDWKYEPEKAALIIKG